MPAKTPRRQPNVEGGRDHRYVVKVSEKESGLLEQEAKAQGVTVARLMVEMALARDGSETFATGLTVTEKRDITTSLWQLRTLVGKVSVNINQVAKFANETSSFPADATELMLVAREVIVRVEEFVTEFFPTSQLAKSRKEVMAKSVWLDKGWASLGLIVPNTVGEPDSHEAQVGQSTRGYEK